MGRDNTVKLSSWYVVKSVLVEKTTTLYNDDRRTIVRRYITLK